MIDTVPRPDAGITEFLAARARHASDNQLAASAVSGLVAAIALLIWRGPGWYVLLPIATCAFAFGTWGIADRELAELAAERTRRRVLLRGIEVGAAVLGFAGGVFLLMVILAGTLGRIIS